jgi:hypothetical protein
MGDQRWRRLGAAWGFSLLLHGLVLAALSRQPHLPAGAGPDEGAGPGDPDPPPPPSQQAKLARSPSARAGSAPPPLIDEEFSPVLLSARAAQGLRIHQEFPAEAGALLGPGARPSVAARLCVSESGAVTAVAVAAGGSPRLERALRTALHSWRYRAYEIDGVARPFCHAVLFAPPTAARDAAEGSPRGPARRPLRSRCG